MLLSIDDPRWCSFVSQSRSATPFHHPAWAQLLSQTYRYRAFAIGVMGDDDRLSAGTPFLEVRSLSRRRRWISLPFTDECPPLAVDAAARRDLIAALASAQGRLHAPALELRGKVDACGWILSADAVIHELDLDPEGDDVHERFSRLMRRNIARAERDGVTVRRAADARDLEAFYRLHTRTRRRQGVPVQPRRFFTLLWSHLIEPGLGSILLADAGDRPAVAGALFLRSGGTTIYKFGASDPEWLRFRPNHLIFATAIREARQQGDHRFDFGRTDLNNPGLRSFKSGWGAVERPLRYATLEPGAAAGSEGLGSRALSVAIRRGPKWLCRGTGEALYRYAAAR